MPTKKTAAKKTTTKKAAPKKAAPAKKPAPKKAAPEKTEKSTIKVLKLSDKKLKEAFKGLSAGASVTISDDLFDPAVRNTPVRAVMDQIAKSKAKFSTKTKFELRHRSFSRVFGLPKNLKVKVVAS
jgi:hypothetical protein